MPRLVNLCDVACVTWWCENVLTHERQRKRVKFICLFLVNWFNKPFVLLFLARICKKVNNENPPNSSCKTSDKISTYTMKFMLTDSMSINTFTVHAVLPHPWLTKHWAASTWQPTIAVCIATVCIATVCIAIASYGCCVDDMSWRYSQSLATLKLCRVCSSSLPRFQFDSCFPHSLRGVYIKLAQAVVRNKAYYSWWPAGGQGCWAVQRTLQLCFAPPEPEVHQTSNTSVH